MVLFICAPFIGLFKTDSLNRSTSVKPIIMMNFRASLVALRLAVHYPTATVCPCNCGLGSAGALRTVGSTSRPAGVQVSYSQYRHMSVLYFMRKIPKRFKEFKKHQLNIVESPNNASKYPQEIATYLWLISLNARVHFTNDKWYTSEVKGLKEERPIRELMQYSIDAIDAKGTLVDYHGLAHIIKLQKLKFLSFEGCPHIDDSCLGRLVHLQDSLTHLNINKCPQITEHGLASLHHLRNLEGINMNDLPRVPHRKMVACMLEDILPKLKIGIVTDAVKRHKQQRDIWRQQLGQETSEKKQDTN